MRLILRSLLLVSLFVLSSCFTPQTVKMFMDADGNMQDSEVLRYGVAQFLIENGFGHKVAYVAGTAADADRMLAAGEIDLLYQSGGSFAVSDHISKLVPDVVDVLKKIHLDDDTVKECLQWQTENPGSEMDDTVIRFFISFKSTWKRWVTAGTRSSTQSAVDQKYNKSRFKGSL